MSKGSSAQNAVSSDSCNFFGNRPFLICKVLQKRVLQSSAENVCPTLRVKIKNSDSKRLILHGEANRSIRRVGLRVARVAA